MLLIYRILFSFSCNNTLGLSTVSKAEKGIWKGWLVSITTKYKEEYLPFFSLHYILDKSPCTLSTVSHPSSLGWLFKSKKRTVRYLVQFSLQKLTNTIIGLKLKLNKIT